MECLTCGALCGSNGAICTSGKPVRENNKKLTFQLYAITKYVYKNQVKVMPLLFVDRTSKKYATSFIEH